MVSTPATVDGLDVLGEAALLVRPPLARLETPVREPPPCPCGGTTQAKRERFHASTIVKAQATRARRGNADRLV